MVFSDEQRLAARTCPVSAAGFARLPVAVIGVGSFGARHLAVYAGHPEVEVVAVVDPREETCSMAAQYGVPWFSSLARLPDAVRAVSVAVPPQHNAAIVCQLLGRGCHVLLEKPMATRLADAALLLETAERCGRVLQIGMVERFNPAVKRLESLLRDPVIALDFERVGPPARRTFAIGAVLDLMIHDIDLAIRWVGHPPCGVSVVDAVMEAGMPVRAGVHLDFGHGVCASLRAASDQSQRARRVRVSTARAQYDVDLLRQTCGVREALTVGQARALPGCNEAPVSSKGALAEEIDAFIAAIRGTGAPVVSAREGLDALKVALQISECLDRDARPVS